MLFKPKVSLEKIPQAVVNTKDEKEYFALMEIYELAKWKWGGKDLPTSRSYWPHYKEKTGITIQKKFGYNPLDSFKNHEIFSLFEFYERQNLEVKKIKEIEDYFNSKKQGKLKTLLSLKNLKTQFH